MSGTARQKSHSPGMGPASSAPGPVRQRESRAEVSSFAMPPVPRDLSVHFVQCDILMFGIEIGDDQARGLDFPTQKPIQLKRRAVLRENRFHLLFFVRAFRKALKAFDLTPGLVTQHFRESDDIERHAVLILPVA